MRGEIFRSLISVKFLMALEIQRCLWYLKKFFSGIYICIKFTYPLLGVDLAGVIRAFISLPWSVEVRLFNCIY